MMNIRDSRKTKPGGISTGLAGLALAALLCFGLPGSAQNTAPADSDITRTQLSSANQFLEGHPEIAEQLRKDPSLVNNVEFVEQHPALQQYLQQHPEVREEVKENPSAFMRQDQRFDRHEDVQEHRWQLATTDQFLDTHPEIAEQLRKNPSLVNNQEFVESHPALQQYLQQHPEIREELKQNPNAFLQQEQRYDRREDAKDQHWRMATTDQFLDSHPEIAEQLRKDPSLVNDQKFVQSHPALQQYLQQHPEIRDEFKENPNAFMQQEQRFDGRDRENGEGQRGGVAATDQFLDKHPEIAEQLRKDPSLLNNQKFVQSHPALQQYLQQHPELRSQAQENPAAFMQQQQRYEQREGASARGSMMQPGMTQPGMTQPGTTRQGTTQAGANFGEFLGSHSGIAQQLSQDPSLLNSKQYLEQHPDLQQYLRTHPEAKQQFNANPTAFTSSFQSGTNATSTTGSKPKP